jgi:hypothetical protein
MPLFDDTSFDFDFSDYSNFSIPDIDLSGFDWGNVDFGIGDLDLSNLGSLDLGSLENFGFDLSDLGDFDIRDIGDLANWGVDVGLDTILDPFEIDGLQGSRTEGNILDSLGIETDPYGVDGLQGSRTEDTALQSLGVETDPYGVDGLQGSRNEDTALTGTDGTNTIKEIIKTVTKFVGNKDNAALMAMLGGLLGLLGRQGAPSAPPGYKGGIPKYMATRGKPGEGTRFVRQAAGGGLMGLKQGRYLGGPTDGMADKIKTDIDGKQPARLSHGEFVIPADVVSHLGNGNSDAGADVLYDMMSKVRKARTGNSKQGKQINPRQYTPA